MLRNFNINCSAGVYPPLLADHKGLRRELSRTIGATIKVAEGIIENYGGRKRKVVIARTLIRSNRSTELTTKSQGWDCFAEFTLNKANVLAMTITCQFI